jgi:hypothetical protein
MATRIQRPGAVLSLAIGLAILLTMEATAVGIGEKCAGFIGIECDEGLWCEMSAGLCKAADAQGRCVKAAELCTRIVRPVCGCDDRTYGNDCERRAAKVQKAYDGRCK